MPSHTEEEKQKKLDRLLSLLDPEEAINRSDFEKFASLILDLVEKALARFEENYHNLNKEKSTIIEKNRNDYVSGLTDLKNQTNQLFVGDQLKRMEGETKASFDKRQREMSELIDKKLQEADYKVSQLKPIKGDKGDRGDAGPMPTEHLDLMKQMMAELKKAQDILSNLPRGRAMGRAKVPITRFIDLTDQVNGSATTFTLPPDKVRVHGVLSTQFPFAISSSDISKSGNQITLNSTIAPRETGQTLLIFTDAL